MHSSSSKSALRARVPFMVAILALAALLVSSVASAAPVISGEGTFTYHQGDLPLDIGTGITLTGGSSYGGQFVQFAVATSTVGETLSLVSVGSPDTASGAVSVVGSTVYLGNGSSADVIGTIDATDDGTAGQTLRVNFADEFVNPSFEDGLNSWTVMNQRIDLGTTVIAGCTTVDTSTYTAPPTTNEDNNVPSTPGAMLATAVTTGSPTEGTQAAQLQAGSMSVQTSFDVVHGPAIFSSPFDAVAGDKIDFDWRGVPGFEDYHVFGYLLRGCTQLEVLDSTGGVTSAWTTQETMIPITGTYRIVFVSGTFDADGGHAAGASLLVDNIRLDGSTVTDAVVEKIARKLQYANSSVTVASTRTVDVTAQSALAGTGFGAITVELDPAPFVPPTSAPSTTSPPTTGPPITGPGPNSDLGYLGVVPLRLWDSRGGSKPAAASVRELVVRGVGGVPSDATAVLLNVTVDRPDGSGFVTVFPCGGLLPLASNVNFVADQTVANAVTVAVGEAGKVCVYTSTASHLVADLNGAFSPSQGTGHLVAGLVPSRLFDSRGGLKPSAGSLHELVVVGQGGVPLDATAVALNVTVDGPDGSGFVTVFPCGGLVPLASNLNFVAGQTVANAVTVAVSVVGRVCVYTSTATHLIVDTNAAFAP